MPRTSVSTWSLHRTLGKPAPYGPGQTLNAASHNLGSHQLLELPACLAKFGILKLELCHFHLPSLETAYLQELRAELEAHNVTLWSFLVDGGDITHPETGAGDTEWIASWFPVAGALGARHARVIAGKQAPISQNLEMAADRLRTLIHGAEPHGIRLLTENWFDLLPQPSEVNWLLDELEDQLGLCLDFGNWSGADKYERLAQIAPRATSCHAKAQFDASGAMDQTDFRQCLDLCRTAGFTGPFTLIFDGPGDEWLGLDAERRVLGEYL